MSAVTTSDRATSLCREYAIQNPVETAASYTTNLDMALLVALSLLPEDKHSMFLECLAYELRQADELDKARLIAKGIGEAVAA